MQLKTINFKRDKIFDPKIKESEFPGNVHICTLCPTCLQRHMARKVNPLQGSREEGLKSRKIMKNEQNVKGSKSH